MPLISVITAIHNGLAFNELFYESLARYTVNPFELIIIDNDSEDGSAAYFESKGAVVIRNKQNYSYPYCQNQGIKKATGQFLAFLNNDIILAPHWDEILIGAAALHSADIISASGIENLGNKKQTQAIDRKWKRTKNPLMIFGFGRKNLLLMHRLMYGNWERFCARKFSNHQYAVVEGIVGNNVMMTRRGLNIVGLWDERMQVADFDLFMRTKKRAKETGDIKPCQIALGAFIHHFGKMTLKYAVKRKPFADQEHMIGLRDKWTELEVDELHPDNKTIRNR
ncbi:MAG: glycosyltransferase family 2 protein [Flavisolibacter sp.]|jgi:glycosyltransferase involved in cell wall biosynthesis|nr:glycosyltransferase family 2 protein [Flavisolibacter sp.]